jgi:hypothetical protein
MSASWRWRCRTPSGVLVVWCESLEEKDFLIEGDPEAESARIRGG